MSEAEGFAQALHPPWYRRRATRWAGVAAALLVGFGVTWAVTTEPAAPVVSESIVGSMPAALEPAARSGSEIPAVGSAEATGQAPAPRDEAPSGSGESNAQQAAQAAEPTAPAAFESPAAVQPTQHSRGAETRRSRASETRQKRVRPAQPRRLPASEPQRAPSPAPRAKPAMPDLENPYQ